MVSTSVNNGAMESPVGSPASFHWLEGGKSKKGESKGSATGPVIPAPPPPNPWSLALFSCRRPAWCPVNHTGSPGPLVCSHYLFLPLHTCPFAFSHFTFTLMPPPPAPISSPPVLPSALGAQSAILAHSVPLQMSLLFQGKLTCFLQPYWFTWILGVLSSFLPTFPPTCLSCGTLLSLPLVWILRVSFPHPGSSMSSVPPPSKHALVDLLSRPVALKGADPTDWTTLWSPTLCSVRTTLRQAWSTTASCCLSPASVVPPSLGFASAFLAPLSPLSISAGSALSALDAMGICAVGRHGDPMWSALLVAMGV